MDASSSHSSHSHSYSTGTRSKKNGHKPTTATTTLVSITVRNDDPRAKAGIQLEQDATGTCTVTNIASNGLFGNTELEIGDVIVSVNKKKLGAAAAANNGKQHAPGFLMGVLMRNAKTLSITVRKNSTNGLPSSDSNNVNVSDNNRSKVDTYYQGSAKHNEDGSLRVERDEDRDDDNNNSNNKGARKKDSKKATMVTISAQKSCPSTSSSRSSKSSRSSESSSNNSNGGKSLFSATTGSPRSAATKKPFTSSSSNSNNTTGVVGLQLAVRGTNRNNRQLVVAGILPGSIFEGTSLAVGDRLLSINDLSFRQHVDAEYALSIMDHAPLMVTLVVEPSGRGNSNDNSSDEGSGDEFNPNSLLSDYDRILDTDFWTETFRPVTISAPKSCKSQSAGLEFRLARTTATTGNKLTSVLIIESIHGDSIFVGTSLEEGDVVLSINNIDLVATPDVRLALKTCCRSTETIAMVVLKDKKIFKEKGFMLDASVSNLEWKV